MAIMQARYPGRCAATGRRFPAGSTIDYDRATKRAILVDSNPAEDGAESHGAYLARQTRTGAGSVSNVFRTSGGTFYRNKRGRCEDAPCCGCCTI